MALTEMGRRAAEILNNVSDLCILNRDKLETLLADKEINCLDRWRIRLVWAGCYWDGSYINADPEGENPLLHKDGSLFYNNWCHLSTFNSRFLRLWAEILDIEYLGLAPSCSWADSISSVDSKYSKSKTE